jgi:hypothetical protein
MHVLDIYVNLIHLSLYTEAVGSSDVIGFPIINLKSCGEKANLRYYPVNVPGKNEENYKNLLQDIRCPVRDSNQEFVEYK